MAKKSSNTKVWFPIALFLGVVLIVVVIVGEATQYQGFLNPQILNQDTSTTEFGEISIVTTKKQFSAEFFQGEEPLVQTMQTHKISGGLPSFELTALEFDVNSDWSKSGEEVEFWLKSTYPSWIEAPIILEFKDGVRVLKEVKLYPEADVITVSMTPEELSGVKMVEVVFKDLATDLRFARLEGDTFKMPKVWLNQVKVGDELSD